MNNNECIRHEHNAKIQRFVSANKYFPNLSLLLAFLIDLYQIDCIT